MLIGSKTEENYNRCGGVESIVAFSLFTKVLAGNI
jgi:hypothetical protein